jgi:hypothetical protein
VTEPLYLEVMSAREICALPEPPIEDKLLGSMIVRKQRTVIGGRTGEGKTSFALGAVRAIVNGTEFLSWTGAGGRALVIDLEQGLRTVKLRLREAGLQDSDRVDYVRIPDGLALDRNTQHVEAVERLIVAGSYDVVLLDPFYKAHQGDSNAEREIVDLMRVLDRWREDYGFALILPAHAKKNQDVRNTKLTIDDIAGSAAITRGAEIVIGIQRVSKGYSRLYAWKDRDGGDELPVGTDPWGLLFDRDTGFRRDPGDTAAPRDITAEIEQFLQAHPLSTTNDVAKGIGAGRARVSDILKGDPRFTFEPGPNKSRLWVARNAQTHTGHPDAPRLFSGGPSRGPSIEGHAQATHAAGGPAARDHHEAPPDDDYLDDIAADLEEHAA